MSIYLFSKPIRSGKTTALMNWCDQHRGVAGILMPDMDGIRKMYDIQKKEIFNAECRDISKAAGSLITIGKFNFFTSAFEKANQILSYSLTQSPDWLVIDEAGKLELKGEGFYQSVAEALRVFSSPHKAGNLLVTVRDSLCDEIIRHFDIRQYTIIGSLELLNS